MATIEERVEALERENAQLRKYYGQNFRQQAVEQLIEKYHLSDDYEFFVGYVRDKVEVRMEDTLTDVVKRADALLKSACEKAGVDVPRTPTEEIQDYIEKVKKQEAADAAYAEEMKKSFL